MLIIILIISSVTTVSDDPYKDSKNDSVMVTRWPTSRYAILQVFYRQIEKITNEPVDG